MPVIVCNVAALVVAGLFYTWRAYHVALLAHHRTLRERVAYMLWVMANNADPCDESSEAPTVPEIRLTGAGT